MGETVLGPVPALDEDAVAGLVDRVLSAYGRLDVLVTSAGVQARGTIDELSAALLLTDPQSAYVTGTVLPVDGGWTSH